MRTRPLPRLMQHVVGSPASTIPGKNALGSLNSLFLGILKSVKTPRKMMNRMTRFQHLSSAVVTLLSRYVWAAYSLARVSQGLGCASVQFEQNNLFVLSERSDFCPAYRLCSWTVPSPSHTCGYHHRRCIWSISTPHICLLSSWA